MYRIKAKTELKPNAEKLANSKKKQKKKNDTKKTNHPKVRQSTWCISNVKNKRKLWTCNISIDWEIIMGARSMLSFSTSERKAKKKNHETTTIKHQFIRKQTKFIRICILFFYFLAIPYKGIWP